MRYIGNKTRLLAFLQNTLDELQLRTGHAIDAFAGTASVSAFLKNRGFVVSACDIMSYSRVFQHACLVVDNYCDFAGLDQHTQFQRDRRKPHFVSRVDALLLEHHHNAPALRPLAEVLTWLNYYAEPCEGFFTRSFAAFETPRDGERMFFTRANGMRIDAIRATLHEWHERRFISDDEYHVLLASLLNAADSVANTAGVYAAYVKSWQANAVRDMRLRIPALVVNTGRTGRALQGNINDIISSLNHAELLYLDPPYNTRQYRGYYHVPELIARGWFSSLPQLRGKTGLLDDPGLNSEWSRRHRCVTAFERLIADCRARHVLLSYNSEGIIPSAEIQRIFRHAGKRNSVRRFEQSYSRYRSDSDHASRRYKADEVVEYLYYVELPAKNPGRQRASSLA